MSDLTDVQSDDARKLLDTAVGAVLAAVIIGLESEDQARETDAAVALWPLALEFSGYQVAKECVLAVAAIGNITNEQLAELATLAMTKANPTF